MERDKLKALLIKFEKVPNNVDSIVEMEDEIIKLINQDYEFDNRGKELTQLLIGLKNNELDNNDFIDIVFDILLIQFGRRKTKSLFKIQRQKTLKKNSGGRINVNKTVNQ